MSDEKKSRAPKDPPRVDVMERSSQTDWDKLLEEIVERREKEPFAMRSLPIKLKDPYLVPHWINRDKYPDAIPVAKQKGWRGVRPTDVIDLDQLGAYQESPDGYVVRGERGNEILMCMPEEYVNRIALAKTRENNRRMGNPNATRAEVIEAYGKKNPEGADLVSRQESRGIGRVTDKYERIGVMPDVD